MMIGQLLLMHMYTSICKTKKVIKSYPRAIRNQKANSVREKAEG